MERTDDARSQTVKSSVRFVTIFVDIRKTQELRSIDRNHGTNQAVDYARPLSLFRALCTIPATPLAPYHTKTNR